MIVLGINSVTKRIGAAIADGEQILAEFEILDPSGHSEKLAGHIEWACEKAKIPLKDIAGIAVINGPGSYGGIRGGLAMANTLAQTLDKPVVAVSCLEAMAFSRRRYQGVIIAGMDACRSDYNVALFASDNGVLKRLTEDFVCPQDKLEKFCLQTQGKICRAQDDPRAADVALLGVMKLQGGEGKSYSEIHPYYSHRPNIREWH